tara:strand:- start:12132 stop:12620 length:489 start_codon:yes stop_codon:yes gene_type:complete
MRDGEGDMALPVSEVLKLDNQLCFPLYAASRLLTRLYKPHLDPLGLTYPQYIVLMILWEEAPCPVKTVSRRAILNTNTLTPLLKRLEQLGLIRRQRCEGDERQVMLALTESGLALRDQCACIPTALLEETALPVETLLSLRDSLNAVLPVLQQALEREQGAG